MASKLVSSPSHRLYPHRLDFLSATMRQCDCTVRRHSDSIGTAERAQEPLALYWHEMLTSPDCGDRCRVQSPPSASDRSQVQNKTLCDLQGQMHTVLSTAKSAELCL